jgi:stress-induced morphogen
MKRREEDYEIVPQKHFLSTHKSRWAAYRHAEAACVERDANPAEVKATASTIDPQNIINTHFKVLIVSSMFDRLSHRQRFELIYQEFLNIFGVNLQPKGHEKYYAPEKMKLATYIDKNVCSLDPFRFVIFENVTFIIETKTPSQWRPGEFEAPDSERFGSSHFDLQSLNVPSYSLAPSQKKRVKQLAVDVKNDPNLRMMQMMGSNPASSKVSSGSKSYVKFTPDFLGVDPSVSGVFVSAKKKGGVYGHFFQELPPAIKDLVMGRYILNKKLIQEEGVKKKPVTKAQAAMVDTFQPKTTMSMLRKKIEKAATEGEYDRGTNSEAEMIDEVFIYAKTIDRWVVPLQRLWRIRYYFSTSQTFT